MHSARPFPGVRTTLGARTALAAATLTISAAAFAIGAYAADAQPASQKPLPVALVDALNTLAGGPHPGFRANHAKGVLVSGTFTPAKTATSLSKAPHFAA